MANMSLTEAPTLGTAREPRRHWLGLPLALPVEGSIGDVLKSVPHFGRQPFAMASVNGDELGVNPFSDMIYKVPSHQGENPIPVGVVSKNYRLVDHHQVLRTVQDALADNDVSLAGLRLRGEWTVYGERARFSFLFPPEERFKIKLAGEDEMRFRTEIFNSVEESCRLLAVAGWLRFVCSNGLIIGTALMHLKQQHRQQLQIEELGRLLGESIQSLEGDKATINQWRFLRVEASTFLRWIDSHVCEAFGPKAAVRVLGIAMDGYDVEPEGDLGNRKPSELRRRKLYPVPGIDAPVKEVFGVSQVLAWLAGQRAEFSEDLEWRTKVPDLIEKLIKHAP